MTDTAPNPPKVCNAPGVLCGPLCCVTHELSITETYPSGGGHTSTC
jgi:hypothetical protein